MRQGAVEIASAPPATIASASPIATRRMADRMASRPEPHWRSMVEAGHRLRQAGGKRDEARGVAALGGIAGDQLLDLLGLEPAVLQRSSNNRRAQLLDAAALVQAADTADRGPAGRDDVGGNGRHRRV